jgi:hypothetical protein
VVGVLVWLQYLLTSLKKLNPVEFSFGIFTDVELTFFFWQGALVFGDESTADVILHLQQDESSLSEQYKSEDETEDAPKSVAAAHGEALAVNVHAQVLTQCRYFDALLSDRWQDLAQSSSQEEREKSGSIHINLRVVPGRHSSSYVATLKLLYTHDFYGTINNVESALNILPIAAELLYDHCISVCVRFLEAVSWTREEERRIVQLVSCLQLEESSALLARLSPVKVSELNSGHVSIWTRGF